MSAAGYWTSDVRFEEARDDRRYGRALDEHGDGPELKLGKRQRVLSSAAYTAARKDGNAPPLTPSTPAHSFGGRDGSVSGGSASCTAGAVSSLDFEAAAACPRSGS